MCLIPQPSRARWYHRRPWLYRNNSQSIINIDMQFCCPKLVVQAEWYQEANAGKESMLHPKGFQHHDHDQRHAVNLVSWSSSIKDSSPLLFVASRELLCPSRNLVLLHYSIIVSQALCRSISPKLYHCIKGKFMQSRNRILCLPIPS